MARTAQQRNKRSKSNARRRPGGGGAQINPNDTLFFPRLRTHAKWMFVFLAIVFSISFVAFGVGSGSTGISDIFNGGIPFFGNGTGTGSSISKAQKAVAKHPKQAQGYRDLATALETKSRNDEAIVALERYTQLKPKDASALSELAGLYLRQVDVARQAAQAAHDEAAPVTGGGFFPVLTNKQGQAVGTDPIVQAVGSKADTIIQAQSTIAQTAGTNAITTYQRLARATPQDSSVQLELAQAAEQLGNTAVAIAAFKQFLKLAPADPSASAVKQRIKQLQPPPAKKKK